MSVHPQPASCQPVGVADLLVDQQVGPLTDLEQDVRVLAVRTVLNHPAVGGLGLKYESYVKY